jgi:hypothetical protein
MSFFGFFKKKSDSVENNETFLRLIRLAQGDAETREKLIAILSLDDANRKAAIHTFVSEMTLTRAPQEFIQAIATFLNDDVAAKALAILKKTP